MSVSLLSSIRAIGCVILAFAALGATQSPAQYDRDGFDTYRHTYDPDHGYIPHVGGYGYGGYGGYGLGAYGGYGGGTVAAGDGEAAAGIGQAAEGIGQERLSTAQAQEAHQAATTQYLKNLQLEQNAALENSEKKAEAAKKWTDAQNAQIRKQTALYQKSMEQMSAYHRLTAKQMDVGSGVLHWPFCLRGPQYSELRQKIDQLYDARTPQDSGTNSSGFDGIQDACGKLQDIVDGEVKTGLPVNDFVTAKHFISSIEYEARFKVKPTK